MNIRPVGVDVSHAKGRTDGQTGDGYGRTDGNGACINCVPRAIKVYQLRPELSEGGVSVASRCPFQV
jgi:hypothetical protein